MKKILVLLLLCLLLVPAALAEEPRIGIISAMPNEVDLLLKKAQSLSAAQMSHASLERGSGAPGIGHMWLKMMLRSLALRSKCFSAFSTASLGCISECL